MKALPFVFLCVCVVGAFHGVEVEDVECVACNSSQFCTAGERFHCPANSDSVFPANEITDCVCRDGFLRQNDTCVLGRQPRYYSQGQAFSCGRANTITITDGASVEAQCVCVRGFEVGAAGTCVKCNAQSYATYPNTTCVLCPDHSQHPGLTGSSDIRQCACDPGSTGSNGSPCSLCPPGTTKSVRGNSTCVFCAADTFSDTPGTVDLACTACHANSSSSVGSAERGNCRCNPGFELDGPEACVMCDAGKVKPSDQNVVCALCTDGFFQDETGQTVCDKCGLRSVPVSDHDECVCQPKAYEANKTNGLAVCLKCPVNTFQPDANQQTCDLCPEHKLSPAGSEYEGDCRCEAGYFESVQGQACSKCAGGTYKTYTSYDDYEVCISCPDYAHSGKASTLKTDCICNAGYSGPDGGPCEACPAGTFKAENGSAECSVCPIDTYQNLSASTACASCMPLSLSMENSSSIEDCMCDEGVGRLGPEDNPRCVPCEPGEYEDYTCLDCPEGQFTNSTRATKCFHCEDHSNTWSSESMQEPNIKCDCDPGYTTDSEASAPVCDACVVDTFKEYWGSSDCDSCGPAQQSQAASVAGGNCSCNIGYQHEDELVCAVCVLDHYQHEIGKVSCLACPAHSHTLRNTSTALVDCICDIGFSGPDGGPCEACDPGSYKEFAGNASCELCPADHYQPASSASACLQCQAFSFTLPGAVELARCTCNDGFTPVAGPLCLACAPGTFSEVVSQVCTNCSGGNFSSEHGVTACSVCPSNSLSHEKPHVDCQCDAGYAKSEYSPAILGNVVENSRGFKYYTETKDAPITLHTGELSCRNVCNNPPYYPTLSGECIMFYAMFWRNDWYCKLYDKGPISIGSSPGSFIESSYSGRMYLKTSSNSALMPAVLALFTGHTWEKNSWGTHAGGDGVLRLGCVACFSDHYKDHFGNSGCTPCQSNSHSEAASVQQAACMCNTGYEQDGEDACRMCEPGTFSNVSDTEQCPECPHQTFSGHGGLTACTDCLADSSVNENSTGCDCHVGFTSDGSDATGAEECVECEADTYKDATGNDACTACQSHAQSVAGAVSFEQCLCDEGYQRVGRECVACPVGTFKDHTNNSYQCESCTPDRTFTTKLATTECTACTATCADGDVRHFASRACNATHDVGCSPCTICNAGTYAFPECSDARNRDRNDTECPVCPADRYCEGHLEIDDCPLHSHSPAGSTSIEACTCVPGKYMTPEYSCEVCPINHYCADNAKTRCPAHSLTRRDASSVLLDCTCRNGHYKNESSEEHFLCALCTENDYCFNNSLYNCSDERMESEAGSSNAAACLCVSGFYNNGTKCDECQPDAYCEEGNLIYCAADRWTQGVRMRGESEDCLCRPGLYEHPVSHACEVCPEDMFCEGDSVATSCPSNSSTVGFQRQVLCSCSRGFENRLIDNQLTCAACADGFFKTSPGNRQCEPCFNCTHSSTFETGACVATSDRTCGECTTCEQPFYRAAGCTVQTDTVCETCTVCNFTRQVETHECNADTYDAQCTGILFDYECNPGSVAGNHSRRLQPTCLACQVHPSTDPASTWHRFTTQGARYADVFTCSAECRGFSRLRDPANHAKGCESCETGNVLFRNMLGGCEFSCRRGFELNAAGTDCELPVLRQLKTNTLPSMHISNWRYERDGHVITIAHTDTNRFLVLVGSQELLSCMPHTCCYADHIRVSTKQQMGIVRSTSENCSRDYELEHTKVSDTQIEVYISQAELPLVGACHPDATGMLCEVVVTLLDVTFWRPISQTLRLHVNTTGTVLAFNTETQYLPLAEIRATIILVRHTPATRLWQVALWMPTAANEWNVSMSVRGMSFHYNPEDVCGHYPGGELLARPSFVVSEATRTTFIAHWDSSQSADTVSVLMHLQRGDAEMNIAVVRNLSHATAQCQLRPPHMRLETGETLAVFGLGAAAVGRLRHLSEGSVAKVSGYGNADKLVTFVARGTTASQVVISLPRLLIVYLTIDTAVPLNVTHMHNGKLVFRYAFRQWCRSHAGCEYEYVAQYAQALGRNALIRVDHHDCSDPTAAHAWITLAAGAHTDAGHVDALCALLAAGQDRHAVAYMTVTGHHLNPAIWDMVARRTLVFPQFNFLSTVA